MRRGPRLQIRSLVVAVWLFGCRPPSGHATLVIDASHIDHPISPLLFGDQVETIESDGIWDGSAGTPRQQTVDLIRPLGMTLLRYPGGTPSDFFHWAQVVGPLAGRVPQINPFSSTAKNTVSTEVTYGPDEAASLAQSLGADLLITANVGTGTPDEAALWLAHQRALGFRATYWEIGNEVWINGTNWAANTQRKSPQDYAALFDQFARALRAVDPTVKVGAIGCHDSGQFNLCQVPTWNQDVLLRITEPIDFFSVHNSYAPAVGGTFVPSDSPRLFRAMLAAPEYIRANFRLQEQDLDAALPGKVPPLAVTEHAAFFVPAPDPIAIRQLERNLSLGAALFSAASFNTLIADPRIQIANHLKLASPYWQALVSPAFDGHSSPAITPYGLIFRRYAAAAGGGFVSVALTTDTTFDSEAAGIVPKQKHVPSLDATAVIPKGGDRLWLYVVNRDLDRDVETDLTLSGFSTTNALAEVVDGSGYDVFNTSDVPDRITAKSTPVADLTHFTFPAHSFTWIRYLP